MGLPPWETSDSQLFALITGTNSGLGFGIATRLIDEFLTSPSTPPTKHLILIVCTRSAIKTRFTISRLRAHLRKLVDYSSFAKKLRTKAAAEGKEYKWEDMVQRVHFLGVEVDLCDLKSVYALADRLVNGTVGSPDATTFDGMKLPHGSPGTQSYSDDIEQDQWALSQKAGSIGAQRSWGWGLNGLRIPRLDVVIFSAGIGGWKDGWKALHWFDAVRDVLFDTVEAVTWPTYKITDFGLTVKPQESYGAAKSSDEITQPLLSEQVKPEEPPLGKVFCSNVFGHYILAHELMPLLSRPASTSSKFGGKIVFVSSVEALADHFDLDDIQGLRSDCSYENTKRLVDLLSITSDLPSTARITAPYFNSSNTVTGAKAKATNLNDDEKLPAVRPQIHLAHPGIFASEIMPLPAFLVFIYKFVFLFARWIGSPWHPTEPYKAAVAPVWLALTEPEVLEEMEGDGARKVKWGSSTDRSGEERVMKTEVPGWGWDGTVELAEVVQKRKGRQRATPDATKESIEEFEVLGVKCWTQMEDLRKEWEGILGVKKTS